ncbi:MAG: hypothetical protein HWD61_01325 [Parachlamydiaceae bacterium]|nr:MAG: hypothetical protein HWD61_01325 [Parachlamydiaceae bacterium]
MEKIGIVALYALSTAIVCLPLSIVQTMKWVIWNPIELILTRKVTTESPMEWWVQNCASLGNKILTKAPERAVKTYAQQLLRAKVVTDENIEGFVKLIKYVKKLMCPCRQLVLQTWMNL